MDNFTKHYLIAALWSSTDDNDEPFDLNYNIDDIAPESIQEAMQECKQFQEDEKELLAQAYEHYVNTGMASHSDAGSPEACAGHDFWLTRNHHGVGFWDRGMGPLGDELTNNAQAYGECYFYIGDNGLIYMD